MTISRRQALGYGGAGALAVGTMSFVDWIGEARAQYRATRYDTSSPEGRKMLQVYADAVGRMKTRDPTDPLSWQFQFFTHWMPEDKTAAIERIYGPDTTPEKMAAEAMWDTCRGHDPSLDEGDWFSPWHRMYVLYLERIVRKVSGNEDFTLPYWDYTDPDKALIPEEFRDPDSPLFVADRNDGINEGTVPMRRLSLGFMERSNYLNSANGLPGFNATLDGNPHGQVHVQVGTTSNMGNVPTAANDPVFWVHHAQVDRCWASWNAAGGANPTDAGWTGKAFQFYDPVENKLVSVETATVVSTEALNYGYQTLIPKPGAPVAMVSADKLATTTNLVLMAAAEGAAPSATTRAAAPETGAHALGAAPTSRQVALPQRMQSLRMGSDGLDAGSGPRLYLVISNLVSEVQPGVLYDIYLGGAEVANAQAEEWRVGEINFFNAARSMEEVSKANNVFSFDVTDHIAVLRNADATLEAPQVTFAPAGTPEVEAQPLIGDIRFVEE